MLILEHEQLKLYNKTKHFLFWTKCNQWNPMKTLICTNISPEQSSQRNQPVILSAVSLFLHPNKQVWSREPKTNYIGIHLLNIWGKAFFYGFLVISKILFDMFSLYVWLYVQKYSEKDNWNYIGHCQTKVILDWFYILRRTANARLECMSVRYSDKKTHQDKQKTLFWNNGAFPWSSYLYFFCKSIVLKIKKPLIIIITLSY